MTLIGLAGVAAQSCGPTGEAPRFWNDRELADWATPITALDVRPSHFSEREYYAAAEAEWVRTYPVYTTHALELSPGRHIHRLQWTAADMTRLVLSARFMRIHEIKKRNVVTCSHHAPPFFPQSRQG
jgi:hypothetical protein